MQGDKFASATLARTSTAKNDVSEAWRIDGFPANEVADRLVCGVRRTKPQVFASQGLRASRHG